MNSFALEIWDDEGAQCTFYSVRQDGDARTETDKFFERYEDEDHPLYKAAQELLNLVVNSIGDKYGAKDIFINRSKNRGYALPPKPSQRIKEIRDLGVNFPLRLYCYRVNEQLLILFNGGAKESQSDQESKELRTKFYEIQSWIQRIEDDMAEGLIQFNPQTRQLEDFQGNLEIEL